MLYLSVYVPACMGSFAQEGKRLLPVFLATQADFVKRNLDANNSLLKGFLYLRKLLKNV